MYGIDYQVRDICVEHRRSLLTLLKLQFHSFEPCYVKVPPNAVRPPSQGKMIPSSSGSSPFGVFSLLSKDKADLETLFFAPTEGTPPLHPDLQMEIYHDREELDLICAGKVSQIILQEIKPDVDDAILRQDSLMQSTSYFQLFAMAVLTLPLRHKCQGKFSIDAGTVEISIKLYRIDVNKVHRQTFVSAFPTTNHVDPAAHHCNSSTCKVCNPYQSNMFG